MYTPLPKQGRRARDAERHESLGRDLSRVTHASQHLQALLGFADPPSPRKAVLEPWQFPECPRPTTSITTVEVWTDAPDVSSSVDGWAIPGEEPSLLEDWKPETSYDSGRQNCSPTSTSASTEIGDYDPTPESPSLRVQTIEHTPGHSVGHEAQGVMTTPCDQTPDIAFSSASTVPTASASTEGSELRSAYIVRSPLRLPTPDNLRHVFVNHQDENRGPSTAAGLRFLASPIIDSKVMWSHTIVERDNIMSGNLERDIGSHSPKNSPKQPSLALGQPPMSGMPFKFALPDLHQEKVETHGHTRPAAQRPRSSFTSKLQVNSAITTCLSSDEDTQFIYASYWVRGLHTSINDWLHCPETKTYPVELQHISLTQSKHSCCPMPDPVTATLRLDASMIKFMHIRLPMHARGLFTKFIPLDWVIIEACWKLQDSKPSITMAFPEQCITSNRIDGHVRILKLQRQGLVPAAFGTNFNPKVIEHFMTACATGAAEIYMEAKH